MHRSILIRFAALVGIQVLGQTFVWETIWSGLFPSTVAAVLWLGWTLLQLAIAGIIGVAMVRALIDGIHRKALDQKREVVGLEGSLALVTA